MARSRRAGESLPRKGFSMRLSHSAFAVFVAAFAIGVPSAALLAADEEKNAAAPAAATASDEATPTAAAAEATSEKPKKAKAVRLTKPWKDITSLTDEQ